MSKRVKDGIQGRVARFRVPGGAQPAVAAKSPEPADVREPDEPDYGGRPMPLGASILWQPVGAEPGRGPGVLPIFIAQHALLALNEHCAAAREPCFGLLSGKLFRPDDAAPPYLLIDSTIRLLGGVGADAKAALLDGWVVAQDVVRKTGDQLVGWYRGGTGAGDEPAAEVGLTPAEAEIHGALFSQPWQVAVTVAGYGVAQTGGVHRRSANETWARECLPFYEVLDATGVGSDGAKTPRPHWANYRSDDAGLAPTAPRPVPAAAVTPATSAPRTPVRAGLPPPRVLLPDQFGDDDVKTRVPARRVAVYGAVGVLAVIGLLRLYTAIAAPTARPVPPAPAAPSPLPTAVAAAPVSSPAAGSEATLVTPQQRVDRAADTLALAIAAFDLRAQLFASRQMQCPELARGLVLVEERWTSYNTARKTSGLALDSSRTARDRALYADADAVERRFERSGCPRP